MITNKQANENRDFWLRFMSKKHKRRTESQWLHAYKMAINWDTCGCGSINDGLPRQGHDQNSYSANAPMDEELLDLGAWFMGAVGDQDLNRSRYVFNQIQQRAAEVLQCEYVKELWL